MISVTDDAFFLASEAGALEVPVLLRSAITLTDPLGSGPHGPRTEQTGGSLSSIIPIRKASVGSSTITVCFIRSNKMFYKIVNDRAFCNSFVTIKIKDKAMRYSFGDQDAYRQNFIKDGGAWKPGGNIVLSPDQSSAENEVLQAMVDLDGDKDAVIKMEPCAESQPRTVRLKAVRTDQTVTDLGDRTITDPALIYARKVLSGMKRYIKHVSVIIPLAHGQSAIYSAYRDFDRSSSLVIRDKWGNCLSRHEIKVSE